MAEAPDPGPQQQPPQQRPAPVNPSVESTRLDDAHDRAVHEAQEGLGAAVGTGLGCLGVTLAPWLMILFGVGAAVILIAIVKGCGGAGH